VRITYSILKQQGRFQDSSTGQAAEFIPFIYSIEVYSNDSLSKRLGVIPKVSPLAPRNPEELRAAEERAKQEAPEKLRALLATLPVFGGTYVTGYGPTKLRLSVKTFDAGTGSVSAEAEWFDGVRKQFGAPYGALGSVSGDTLRLTVTIPDERKPRTFLWKLQLDKSATRLVGDWSADNKECASCNIWFDLQ
jgi:hypothetical protein